MVVELLWCFMHELLSCSKREEGRTDNHGLWITLMFHAWITLFKAGRREDRTLWTLGHFHVSCMNYFDVQRRRKGGQNIMDFELFWCFMHELLWCSKRKEGRTEHHGFWITLTFHAWISLMFKEGGREDGTSWTLPFFDVSCMSYFDVQRGRKGGQNIMDFELLWCFMRELLWCSKSEEGRTEHHGLWITLMFHARIPLMFKEGGREDRTSLTLNYFDVSRMSCFVVQRGRTGGQNIMDFELFDVFMHELLWCSKREDGRTEHHGLWITLMFHAWITLMFKRGREGGRSEHQGLNYFDVWNMN